MKPPPGATTIRAVELTADGLTAAELEAAARRDDGRAEAFRAVVEAERAREQAVAQDDLEDVALRDARRREAFGHALRPDVEVALRVGHDRRLPGRSGRRVNANDVVAGRAAHPERVAVAEVLFHRERELPEIGEGRDVVGVYPRGLHLAAIDGVVPPYPRDDVLQCFELLLHDRSLPFLPIFRKPCGENA